VFELEVGDRGKLCLPITESTFLCMLLSGNSHSYFIERTALLLNQFLQAQAYVQVYNNDIQLETRGFYHQAFERKI
jgi:hypothetical protein